MEDVNKYIESMQGATRGERLNMAIVALLFDIKESMKVNAPKEKESLTEPLNALKEHTNENSEKPKKSTRKKVIK